MYNALAFLLVLFFSAPVQDKPKQDPSPKTELQPADKGDKDAANKPRDPFEVSVPTFPNASCPIMGKPISSVLFTDTQFGRIYICCKSCTKKIRQDPETAYKTAYPTTKLANNPICPVMGEKNEGSEHTVRLQGYDVALCCEECILQAMASPQTTLVKALDPKVQDLGNKTCPITGEAVTNNAYCLVGDTLIHLSSPGCVEGVKKDPKGTLEKAKKIALEKPKDSGHGKDGHGPGKDKDGEKKPEGLDGQKNGG